MTAVLIGLAIVLMVIAVVLVGAYSYGYWEGMHGK